MRPGFCTVCDFAHARPIMLSIPLVGASVSEPPLVDSTDALSRCNDGYIDVRTFTSTAHARRYAQT